MDNSELVQLEWFHPNCTRHVADCMLMANGKDGSYLLRQSVTNPGEFSLSVRCSNSVKHFQIGWDGKSYLFGMGKFGSLREFVEHFESKPLIGGESGVLTLLKHPYPRNVAEPVGYDTVRVHAEWGKSMGKIRTPTLHDEDDQSPVLSMGSKEGYLTKLGKTVKNWKTRWFVLYKNELRYYKTRNEKQPIRVIDLGLCSEVAVDSSQDKANCFRVVTKDRTFYCYASTSQEMHEWLDLLQWKLEHPN